MIATLARSESSPYFGIADQRSYDVWGSLRYSRSSGDPRQRYCANLGHVQDDESGLIYMRARYYEPWSGRFVSEDPAKDGANWFAYCGNDPLNRVDPGGESWWEQKSKFGSVAALAWALYFLVRYAQQDEYTLAKGLKFLFVTVAGSWFSYQMANAGSPISKIIRQIGSWVDKALRLPVSSTQIAFYVGYALFLQFVLDDIETWTFSQ